jgi:carnitine 3-dehydrogenase
MIERVAVIGAGTIGASWAAIFLARGLKVAVYDPAPNGEAFSRRFVEDAWPTLQKLGRVLPDADAKGMTFTREVAAALKGAQFVQ